MFICQKLSQLAFKEGTLLLRVIDPSVDTKLCMDQSLQTIGL